MAPSSHWPAFCSNDCRENFRIAAPVGTKSLIGRLE
jgi:hypothetical protein